MGRGLHCCWPQSPRRGRERTGCRCCADVLQAVQQFGTLSRKVFAYSCSLRSRAAAAARATRIAGCLPLEDAGGEEKPKRTAGPRRPHLSDAQRQASWIARCLHQKRSLSCLNVDAGYCRGSKGWESLRGNHCVVHFPKGTSSLHIKHSHSQRPISTPHHDINTCNTIIMLWAAELE